MFILSIGGTLLLILVCIAITLIIINFVLISKYKDFINEHSISIKELKHLNNKYNFKEFNLFYFDESFDNEQYYNKLSTKDLLVYDLIKNKNAVKENISKAIYNSNLYNQYKYEIKNIKKIGQYDTLEEVKFKQILLTLEEKMFNSLVKHPSIYYKLRVSISLTNINDKLIETKSFIYNMPEIEEVLEQIEDKTNDRYNNEDIWNSICRVERAKVTNKLRFYIYNRDGHRCCKCGRKTNDLEIDHIMPISKGGKTHPDNLQTLCKKCNMEKSNVIEKGTVLFNDKVKKICPKCGAPLKKVNGKYGMFYGCMNYPNCKYTERM